jgi:hypothetical protein
MAGLNSIPSRNSRAADLDLLKTVLVVGMIGAHVVQLITFGPKPEAKIFAEYANLVSFSGFLFAFGVGLGLPKPDRVRSLWSQLRAPLLLLLAVCVSSFGFALLVDRAKPSVDLLLDVVSMRRLFGWSEFLATFFVLSLLTLAARPLLLKVGRNPWLLAIVTGLCLTTTMLKTGAIVPLLPTVVSHTQFANFPLLPYLPWFLIGIWYGSHPVKAWQFVLGLAVTGWLYWVTWQTGEFPQRFPPSVLWIVGPAAILLFYLAASRWLAARIRVPDLLLTPGRHVLSFLVLSNLALFATRYLIGRPVRNTPTAVLVATALLLVLTLAWRGVELWRGRKTIRQQSASPLPG